MTLTRLALAFGLALSTTPALAEDMAWGTFGNWDVAVDPTLGNGCYASVSWNDGTMLRIGRNPQLDNFYMLLSNESWTSLEDGETYMLEMQFDSRSPWDVSATGYTFYSGGMVYLRAQSAKMDFIHEFQKALAVTVDYNGSEIANLKLNGSSRAWSEVERCQLDADRTAPRMSDDPFAGNDPFASGGQSKTTSSKKPYGN